MIRHFTLTIQEKHAPKEFPEDGLHIWDITEEVQDYLSQSEVMNGSAIIQTLHTTLALAINENEGGLMRHDFPRLFRQIAPHDDHYYEHDDFEKRTEFDPNEPERINGYSHCRALLLPSSITVIVADGKLRLGTWQKILLFELDGRERKHRKIALMFDGE